MTTQAGKTLDPFPTATPAPVALYLNRLVVAENASRTLEVGMACGLATLAICQAHKERGRGSHIAIDPFQKSGFGDTALVFDAVWMPAIRRVVSFARHHRGYRMETPDIASRGRGTASCAGPGVR